MLQIFIWMSIEKSNVWLIEQRVSPDTLQMNMTKNLLKN